jgi:hypothetical protein
VGWAGEGAEDLDRGCKEGNGGGAFSKSCVDELQRSIGFKAIRMEPISVSPK